MRARISIELFDFFKEKYGLEVAKGYLKELMVQGRFTVKKNESMGWKAGYRI